MLKISAMLAIPTAMAMAGVKFHLDEQLWWPFVVPEYVVATLLVLGARLVLLRQQTATLGAGWGAAAMLSWTTLSHHLEPSGSFREMGPVEFALALELTVSAVGLAAIVVARR